MTKNNKKLSKTTRNDFFNKNIKILELIFKHDLNDYDIEILNKEFEKISTSLKNMKRSSCHL